MADFTGVVVPNPKVGPMALRRPVQPQARYQVVGFTGTDGTSIVYNPGFESTGLGTASSMVLSTAFARSGVRSALYTSTGAGTGGCAVSLSAPGFAGGEKIAVSIWILGDPANTQTSVGGGYQIQFLSQWSDSTGRAPQLHSGTISLSPTSLQTNCLANAKGSWTLMGGVVTVPTGYDTVTISPQFNGANIAAGDKYYIDDPVVVSPGTQVGVGLFAGGQVSQAGQMPVIIANPQVGPQALRYAFPRKPLAQARVVGLTQSGASSVAAGVSAAGVLGISGNDSGTSVAAGLTAAGSVGEATSAPDTVSVGLAAAGVSGGVTGVSLVETVGLIASDLLGVNSGATTTVSVGLTAAGSVGVVGAAATAAVVGLSAGGVEGENVGASQAVTVVLSAAGSVAFVGTASLRLTAVLAANGYVSMFGGATVTVQVASTVAGSIIAGYGGVEVIAPEVRTYMIPAEDRTCAIPAEDRTCVVV